MLLTVDASIFVSAFFPDDPFHVKARPFADQVFNGVQLIKQPTTIVVEVPCALTRRYKQTKYDPAIPLEVVKQMSNCAFISWQIIDRSFAIFAAEIGVKFGFRGMDAIYAATAIANKLPLLTEDAAFKKAKLPVPVMSLADLTK